MTRNEFGLFAAALKTYYPKDGILPNRQAMELWYRQLQDIPYEIAEIALNKWVTVSKWAPAIADIREQATVISLGDKPLWSDGWEEVIRAIKKYGSYRENEALQSMTELTRKTVKRLGFRNICVSENITADRANFRIIFEQLSTQEQSKRQMPANLFKSIENLRIKEAETLPQSIVSKEKTKWEAYD